MDAQKESALIERERAGGGAGERKTNWLLAEVRCQASEESCSFRHCGKDHGNEGPSESEQEGQLGRSAAPPSD